MAKEMQVAAGTNLPAELADAYEQAFKDDLAEGGFILPKIKIVHASQLFEFPEGDTAKKFQGILLQRHGFKVCWLKKNEDEIVPPDCFAADGITGSAPVSYANDHDGNEVSVFGSCNTCWYNKFGSAIDNSGNPDKGKRCATKAHLMIHRVGMNQLVPSVLTISSTSLRAVDEFRSKSPVFKLPVIGLLAEFSLDKQQKGSQVWSVLKIDCVGTIRDGDINPEDAAASVEAMRNFGDQLADAPPVDEPIQDAEEVAPEPVKKTVEPRAESDGLPF